MSAIADADDGGYACNVTCDANNNITQFEEVQTSGANSAVLLTDFSYDWGNRLTEHKTTQNSGEPTELITIRGHSIDAIGRTVQSEYSQYPGGTEPPRPDSLEHVYSGAKMLQNYDGTSSYGEVWHWAGAGNTGPLKSPNADTASQKGYNISNDKTPQRRTFTTPTSEGDQRHLYGQGKPQAKNSSGAGANWYIGEQSQSMGPGYSITLNSRTMFDGTVTATDMDRATDAREKGRIGIFGTGNAYAGSSGRVTSERVGRDLNPLGRGSGWALVGGMMNYGPIAPTLPKYPGRQGTGSSVNNGTGYEPSDGAENPVPACCKCGGYCCVSLVTGSDCCCPTECGQFCGDGSDDGCIDHIPCLEHLKTHPCNLGGGGGGGGIAQQRPPGSRKPKKGCLEQFEFAKQELVDSLQDKDIWKKCCCSSPSNCPTCEKLLDWLVNNTTTLIPMGISHRYYKRWCFVGGSPRVLRTHCTMGTFYICCPNFNPPFTIAGRMIGTSNSDCAAMVFLAYEILTCHEQYDATNADCITDIVNVANCLCESNPDTKS